MSKYFTNDEMTCKCGCGSTIVSPRLFPVLDKIRESIVKPVYILSGFRCPSHNASVGGVSDSQHLLGTAADITYDGIDVNYLGNLAINSGASGVGLYFNSDFVHVDVRLSLWNDS